MFSLYRPALFALTLALAVMPSVALGQEPDPITTPIVSDGTTASLTSVVDAGHLIAPIWAASAPGDNVVGRLFIADQVGVISSIIVGGVSMAPTSFFDVKAQIEPPVTEEQKFDLLGVVLHPDYASNGLFYTYTLVQPGESKLPFHNG